MLILSGLALIALFYVIGKITKRSMRTLLPFYLAVWFIASGINMWIGVTQAGFNVIDEALFFVPIFGVPALAAIMLMRRA